jgi:hypothetical protein
MKTLELDAFIDSRHEIHLRLPPQVRQGKARVIVMFEDSPLDRELGDVDDFLDTLPLNAKGRSPEDIQAQVKEERDSWGDRE